MNIYLQSSLTQNYSIHTIYVLSLHCQMLLKIFISPNVTCCYLFPPLTATTISCTILVTWLFWNFLLSEIHTAALPLVHARRESLLDDPDRAPHIRNYRVWCRCFPKDGANIAPYTMLYLKNYLNLYHVQCILFNSLA